MVILNGFDLTVVMSPVCKPIITTSSHLFLSVISALSSRYTEFPSSVLWTEPKSTETTVCDWSWCCKLTRNSTGPVPVKGKKKINVDIQISERRYLNVLLDCLIIRNVKI